MKHWQTLTATALLATALGACSGGDDNDSDDGAPVTVDDDAQGGSGGSGAQTGGGTTAATDELPGGGTAGGGDGGDDGGIVTDDGGATGATTTTGAPADGGPGNGTGGDTGTGTGAPTTTGGGTGGDGGAGTGTTGGGTATGGGGSAAGDGEGLPEADVVSTVPGDPFGYTLETDVLAPAGDGVPTQPQNLRIDLVSSDFAEFNWAPSADDGQVVAYVIERSDGQSFEIRPSLPAGLALDPGTYDEYAKYWNTTSFIDCNSTRFGFAPGSEKEADGPWNCAGPGGARPEPGATYSYTVTAIDDDGNASAPSEPLTISYLSDDAADRTDVAAFLDDFDLVWSDEFDGDAVSGVNWNTSLRGGSETFINGEQQYFVDVLADPSVDYQPFSFDGDALTITAVPTPPALEAGLPPGCDVDDPVLANDPTRSRCEFLSGALSSHDHMQFVYGYVEGRIRASDVSGALTSFYLLNRFPGNNDPENGVYQYHAPEIDILEYLGENPFGDEDAFQTYHFGDVNYFVERSSPTLNHENEDGSLYADEFHTFGVLWEPQLVIWYIDGVEVRRLTGPQIAQQPMNIVNYLVAGSGWAPEPEANGPTLEMEVDYIRLYQREEFQGTLLCGPVQAPVDCEAP